MSEYIYINKGFVMQSVQYSIQLNIILYEANMNEKLYKNKRWLRSKYCEKELSVVEIAELCEVTKTTIYTWIDNFNFSRKEVLRTRPKSRYSLNERYFQNIDNSNKAYWLGFIAADGCVVNEKGRRYFFIEVAFDTAERMGLNEMIEEDIRKQIDLEIGQTGKSKAIQLTIG